MPEFLTLQAPAEAQRRLFDAIKIQPSVDWTPTLQALGRNTGLDIVAPLDLPPFARSAVDGFAVRAADTHGASESLPGFLSVLGEVPMGSQPSFTLQPLTCALIHTGGMLPKEADAVVMLEYTQDSPIVSSGNKVIEIYRPVALNENVILAGEDTRQGEVVIPQGRRLRPVEIGGLMGLGITSVPVARPPRVGLISSGDEVVPPGENLPPGKVFDINSYSLAGLIEQAGGVAVGYGICPDREDLLLQVARRALAACDVVVLAAGSSISARDITAGVIAQLGPPGVLVHGLNIRPGKPTIFASCQGKAVFGLPGNPVSAWVTAWLFLRPVIWAWLGIGGDVSAFGGSFSVPNLAQQTRSTTARLLVNVPSQAGREDWLPVRLLIGLQGERLVEPVYGKSNLILTLVRATGMVRVPAEAVGLEAGETVEVVEI